MNEANFYYKNAAGVFFFFSKWAVFITKYDRYYKTRELLQNMAQQLIYSQSKKSKIKLSGFLGWYSPIF